MYIISVNINHFLALCPVSSPAILRRNCQRLARSCQFARMWDGFHHFHPTQLTFGSCFCGDRCSFMGHGMIDPLHQFMVRVGWQYSQAQSLWKWLHLEKGRACDQTPLDHQLDYPSRCTNIVVGIKALKHGLLQLGILTEARSDTCQSHFRWTLLDLQVAFSVRWQLPNHRSMCVFSIYRRVRSSTFHPCTATGCGIIGLFSLELYREILPLALVSFLVARTPKIDSNARSPSPAVRYVSCLCSSAVLFAKVRSE